MIHDQRVFFGDRQVGEIIDGKFIKHVISSGAGNHYCVVGRGYAISSEVLDDLQTKGVNMIRVVEMTSTKGVKVYEASVQDYLDAPVMKLGDFEEQKCFPLKDMKLIGQGEKDGQ